MPDSTRSPSRVDIGKSLFPTKGKIFSQWNVGPKGSPSEPRPRNPRTWETTYSQSQSLNKINIFEANGVQKSHNDNTHLRERSQDAPLCRATRWHMPQDMRSKFSVPGIPSQSDTKKTGTDSPYRSCYHGLNQSYFLQNLFLDLLPFQQKRLQE